MADCTTARRRQATRPTPPFRLVVGASVQVPSAGTGRAGRQSAGEHGRPGPRNRSQRLKKALRLPMVFGPKCVVFKGVWQARVLHQRTLKPAV